jgi:YesN/AraC family two-component response regulator
MVNLKAMERRYAFENQLLRSVSLGQLHMEDQLMQAFSAEAFEKRTADPLRNAKNYCIIMNTLLRKAAEQGGVHPVHLDRASSEFARKIEHMTSTGENTALMMDMFRTYCRLVRRHSLQKYSPVIRKAILTIDADLSADLSPHVLAESLGISLGYLSTLFRRETGKPLTSYVRQRRMEYAAYLLATTDLQIQTVALHCGIMDVQYFSKLFKRHHDMTPSDYRIAKKQTKPL